MQHSEAMKRAEVLDGVATMALLRHGEWLLGSVTHDSTWIVLSRDRKHVLSDDSDGKAWFDNE